MLRKNQLTGALALALLSGQAFAQDFTAVISFGDSLSDAGNTSTVDGSPATAAGNAFTTNNDPVWAQVLASLNGTTQTHSVAGGTNFAFGGSCAQAAGACVAPTLPRLNQQIGQYLTATGGRADPNALYTVWSGANDIFGALLGGVWTTQAQILGGSAGVAGAVVGNVGTLTNAGANTIVVLNLPDLAFTPQFRLAPATTQAAMSAAANGYNAALNAGLANSTNVLPVNVFAIFNDVLANPTAFGFTNVTGIACGPGLPGVVTSAACGAAGSGNPFTYAAGTNETFFFADGVHPTGGAHRMLANVVYSSLTAPTLISTLPQDTFMTYDDHAQVINGVIFGSAKAERGDGDLQGFAQWNFSSANIDAVGAPSLEGDHTTLTLGGDYRFNSNYSLGFAVSFGNPQSNGAFGGNDGQVNLFSVYGVRRFENAYLSAALTGGSADNKVTRYTQLGALTRNDTGDTGSSHVGAEIGGGFVFGDEGFQHGPYARIVWQNVEVQGYSENSTSTSMRFGDFERESLGYAIGYAFGGETEWGSKAIRPYLNLSYNREEEADATVVQAGSTSLNGTFSRAGFTPSEDWFNANLGLGFGLTDNVELVIGAQGRFGDDQIEDFGGHVGLNIQL